jgi:hypothetical protein
VLAVSIEKKEMTEVELNNSDKLRLKNDMKLSLILGLLFTIILVTIVAIIPGILFLFGKQPTDGFITRSLYILGGLSIPLIAISWKNVIKFIDLKKGVKIRFTSMNYEIKTGKDETFIIAIDNNNQKIKIYDNMETYIESPKPLIVELSKLTKTLLFISHDTENLLEKFEIEND